MKRVSVGADFIFSGYWGGATYSSSNTEESAAFRLLGSKEEGGGGQRLRCLHMVSSCGGERKRGFL